MAAKLSAAQTVRIVQAQPTVDTNAYAAGDLIGAAALDFGNPLGSERKELAGLIQSVTIIDLAAQAADIDVVFFDENPSNTTFNDNAAFDPADADLDNVVGVASITDWKSFNDNAVGQVHNLAIPFVLDGIYDKLYGALVSRGTPTFVAATDVTIRVGVMPLR